jgi:hypothetical protein
VLAVANEFCMLYWCNIIRADEAAIRLIHHILSGLWCILLGIPPRSIFFGDEMKHKSDAKHNITVGQELYIVKPKPYSYSNGLQPVTKVGRDYFYIGTKWGETKFSLETLGEWYNPKTGSGHYSAQAYLTEQDYLDKVQLSTKWKEFNMLVRDKYTRPEHVTLEQINTMLNIINGDKK